MAEGPFEADERALIPSFVPAWGFHPRPDATYFPMPWLLSNAGYGSARQLERSVFRPASERRDRWSAEVDAAVLQTARARRAEAGGCPAPPDHRGGRAQPRPPSPAVLPWYQPRDDERAILARLQREDVRSRSLRLHPLPARRPDRPRGRRARAGAGLLRARPRGDHLFQPDDLHHAPGLRRGVGPGCSPGPRPARPTRTATAPRASTSRSSTSPIRLPRPSTAGCSARPAAMGTTAGWRTSVSTPRSDASRADSDGLRTHNVYLTQYHCGAAAAAPRAIRFVRSGWTGTARCAPVVWRDPSVDWGFDGLESAVINGITMGLSGATWGSDIGGFFALLENRLTPELLKRWIEFGAVSGVMRTQANGIRVPRSARPGVGPRDPARLAPLGQAAHPAVPLPVRGRRPVPAQRAADHAPPRARLPGRSSRRCGGGFVSVRTRPPRCSRAAPGHHPAGSTCPASGWTSGARPATASLTAG